MLNLICNERGFYISYNHCDRVFFFTFIPIGVESSVDIKTLEESIEIFRQRVVESYESNEYNRTNLRLGESEIRDCEMCWIISYKYDVNNPLFNSVEMSFDFLNGRIMNTTYFEIK